MAIDYPFEKELDAIRVKLYEETKDMTNEERAKRLNERAQKAAAKYGFTIAEPRKRRPN